MVGKTKKYHLVHDICFYIKNAKFPKSGVNKKISMTIALKVSIGKKSCGL
jgi:hypothetical protein